MFWARFFFDCENVGTSLKKIARFMAVAVKIMTVLVSVATMTIGIVMLVRGSAWGILVMFFACVPEFALFCGMIPVSIIKLYAAGELIDRVSALEDKVSAVQSDSDRAPGGQ